MTKLPRLMILLTWVLITAIMPSWAGAEPQAMGIVIMHGKGGSPAKHVADLAAALERNGYLVANLEMPWSGKRDYDVDVSHAEDEVETALAALRSKGAKKVFVAGHSQGGLFALHFAGKHAIDGAIAIAPGGDVSSSQFRDALDEPLQRARQLVADGKGAEKTRFLDREGSKGTYPVFTSAVAYVAWFEPEGAMNMARAVRAVNPGIPVLWISPTGDYPPLLKAAERFNQLPANTFNKLYRPDSNHLGSPTASIGEILLWTNSVANGPQR